MTVRAESLILLLHRKIWVRENPHFGSIAWKVSKYGVFSGSDFPVFGLNTEIYCVNLRIQSEYRKIRTRKKSVFGHFSSSAYFTQCQVIRETFYIFLFPYFWNNSLCGISFLQNFKHSEYFWKISCMRISNFCKYSLSSTTANNAKLYKVYLNYLIRTKRFIIIVHEDIFANFTDFCSHKSRKYLQYLQFYYMLHRSSYYHNN